MKLTIAVISYKETPENIEATRQQAKAVSNALGLEDFEIIVVDTLYNLGKNYKLGVERARGEYFVFFPGDNETTKEAMFNVLEQLGNAPVVLTYVSNPEVRNWKRRLLSRAYVLFLNFVFGLKVKYYNGTNLYRTDLLRSIDIKADDFSYSAEIMVKLLKAGTPYIEVPMPIQPKNSTAAFRIKNIAGVIWSVLKLIWEIKL